MKDFTVVGQRYSGVIFDLGEGAFFLQKRDNVVGITNPDLISIFGGSAAPDEGSRECLQREILEELGVRVEWSLTSHLADVLKDDGRGSTTLMSIYLSKQLSRSDVDEIRVLEGRGIVYPNQIGPGDLLSPFCQFIFKRLLS